MSLRGVSDYFTTRLKEIDSSFKQHVDAFNTDNVGATKFDRAYHVLMQDMTCGSPSSSTTTDQMTVEVILFFQGYRDPGQKLIDAYETANEFRINCMRPKFALNSDAFDSIVCTGLKPEPVESNDNAIKMRCTFEVTLTFSLLD